MIKEFNIISLLSKLLIPGIFFVHTYIHMNDYYALCINLYAGMSQNDVILEVVMLTSALLTDPDACVLIIATNLIQLLLSMWKEKGRHDIEILLQLIYFIYKYVSVLTYEMRE